MNPVARRGRYIFGLIVAVLIGGLFALACLGGVIGAAGTASHRAQKGETFGGDIALAIVSAAIVVVCILVGAHLEHQLRRHQPIAESWSATFDPTARSGARSLGFRSARKGRYSPVTLAIYLIALVAVVIVFAVGAVRSHSDGERSSRVQHHGMSQTAVVVRARNHYHSSRGGGYYTADILVSFTQPVDGRTSTTVHYPGRTNEPAGARLQVLVDPNNAGYAELPGAPSTKSWSWILMTVFALFFAALDTFVGLALVRVHRHRRGFNPSRLSQPPVPA